MTPNIKALTELMQLLEGTHPKWVLPEHYIFDMQFWKVEGRNDLLGLYDSKTVNGCQTSGCAMGYAMQYIPTFRKDYKFEKTDKAAYSMMVRLSCGWSDWDRVHSRCGEPLGLSEAEFWYLFGQHHDDNHCLNTFPHRVALEKEPDPRITFGAKARKDTVRRIKKLLQELERRERVAALREELIALEDWGVRS